MGRALTPEEFEKLHRDTARDVFAYLRRRADIDAEDLVAEVYAVAWRRRANLPAPMLRRAWLFGVANTLLQAHWRQLRLQRELAHDLAVVPPGTPGGKGGQADAVVTAALSRLPAADREILRLVTWEGLTPAELAVALGVLPGTARVKLHRARQAFAADPDIQALIATARRAPITTCG